MNNIYSALAGVENTFLQWRRTMEALPLDSWSASVKGLQSTSNTWVEAVLCCQGRTFLISFNSEILYSCADKLENVLDVLDGLQAGLSEVQESFLEMQVCI